MYKGVIMAAGLAVLSACTTMGPQFTRAAAIEHCQEKTRQAVGPTGEVSIGANSQTGFGWGARINIPITGTRGMTPEQYYNNCMDNLAANGQISEGS